ncbi:MAG: hypothetical protein M3256_09330, partial [Actinomycetota bacterium]|nr:hypothetical protein [Actinomycetota bacterium]
QPTCIISGLRAGPPKQLDVSAQDTGSGLQAIINVQITNGTVNVAPFDVGTTSPVVVTASKTDPNLPTAFSFDAVDVAGNVGRCT